MSLEFKQSIEQKSSVIQEEINEVRETITDSSFAIRETCGDKDRTYEMRHYRGSLLRWQENGSVLLIARSSTMAPNEGYLDVKSTGYMNFVSGHSVKIVAEGHKKTGGGQAGSDDEKSIEMVSTGDFVIQSNGKGGIYVTAAKDIEFKAGGKIVLSAAEQVSINTGSQDPVPFGLTDKIGSGKLSISTGQYELSTASYKETVTGSKNEENYGEVSRDQKLNILEPAALGPGAHITTEETVGSLVHKIGHDYILEVDGKMLVKVNNNPAKVVGPLTTGVGGFGVMPTEALKYDIKGTRKSVLNPDPKTSYAQDYVSIPNGNSYTEVQNAAPGNTAFSAVSKAKGDIVLQTTAIGNIGINAGATPANTIVLQNQGGSIRMEANGAMGMIQMIATKEIVGTALKINLN